MSDTVLAGKVAIVTGAGGGIGQAICLTFATAGAKIACLDIDLAPAETTAAACCSEALALRCDVSSEAETRAAAATTVSRFGAVHILDISGDEWSRVFAVNVTGAFLMSRAVLPAMIAAGGGSIIHIALAIGPRRGSGARCLLHV
jgi:NAD(P)-dependent dehydrogenase (short-subunit alcohol dehydrogenase family)